MRLLHLEDSSADAQSVATWLSRERPGCVVQRVATRQEFVAALQTGEFDVVLVNCSAMGFGGLAALALVHRHAAGKACLILAGSIGEEKLAELMRHGANDYVHKSRLARLVPAIEQALWLSRSPERRGQPDEALRKMEARIREQAALLDQAQDAIIVQNLAGAITYWNKGAQQIYGWSAAEATGGDMVALVSLDPGRHRFAREHTLARGEWRGELRHRTREGKEVVVQSRWTLVRDGEGPPTAFLVINTDVTDNRVLEAKFLRAQRLESMGMLVGGIAHDLNNVLAPILMSVELLRTMGPTPEAEKLIHTMHRSVKHGSALVQQLLAFARGAEGQHVALELQPLLIDFVEFMTQTLASNIKLELSFGCQPLPVLADTTQLKQVLMNLCINARDAMPTGGTITITVDGAEIDAAQAHLMPEGQPGVYVVIAVADTGTGIPPKVMERIFDPFFTTKETGHGTGLGLSTVRGIVKGHGGFMTVESEAQRGTTFRIYLPVHVAAAETVSPGAVAAGPTILLVDDEEMVRNALALLLKSEGYQVQAMETGAAAWALLQAGCEQIDLLVTDLKLADMDGFELIAKARERYPQLPVIALTGMPLTDAEGNEKLPGLRILAKPMTRPALMKAVEDALATMV